MFFGVSAIFGGATIVRSNGILAGLLYLLDAGLAGEIVLKRGFSSQRIVRVVSLGLGGLILGSGAFLPQYIAYKDYCQGQQPNTRRPWCNKTIPGIYAFVQSHYWHVPLLEDNMKRR